MRLIVPKLKLGVDASSTAVSSSRRRISEAYLLITGPGPQVTVGFMGFWVSLCNWLHPLGRRVVLRWASLAVSPPACPPARLASDVGR
jgi:hypothetical protein